MSKFKFEPTPKFIRQLKKLPSDVQSKVKEKLKILQEDPSHPSLRTKRHSSSGYFESSINMNYRILWDYEGESIILLIMVGEHDVLN